MSPISLGMLPALLALTQLRSLLSTMPQPPSFQIVNSLWPLFSPNSSSLSMVNDLSASVTFLTSQVESLTSAQAERSATPSPPATSNLEASLKDLSSRVAGLSSHHTTQVAPTLP